MLAYLHKAAGLGPARLPAGLKSEICVRTIRPDTNSASE
jgi:hypothetical protein